MKMTGSHVGFHLTRFYEFHFILCERVCALYVPFLASYLPLSYKSCLNSTKL